jgi:hypothetical protein
MASTPKNTHSQAPDSTATTKLNMADALAYLMGVAHDAGLPGVVIRLGQIRDILLRKLPADGKDSRYDRSSSPAQLRKKS